MASAQNLSIRQMIKQQCSESVPNIVPESELIETGTYLATKPSILAHKRKPKPKGKGIRKSKILAKTLSAQSDPLLSKPESLDGSWSTVVKRGTIPMVSKETLKGTKNMPASRQTKNLKLRQPCSAEIVITIDYDVRVSWSTQCAELCIVGLDDSISSAGVIVAVKRAFEISVELYKAGELQRRANRLGNSWVKCPVSAAKNIATKE
ncbi:hypothetical protein EVAR_6836_1 [Eumeta japonica]|uniref:Uncharacterized protein n=1 Tax=Eumeta variegata TaxID=151549 RepID=A0A4C1U7E6_EUMVA|nr:hypothetical protein EVAR_6836_1 [Eumeta japonica]